MCCVRSAALVWHAAAQVAHAGAWQHRLLQQKTESLNKVADPYKESDPIKEQAFREDYIHPDGSINERVLIMLHKYMPVSSGAVPEGVGVLILACIIGSLLYGWMQSNKCWEPRNNDHTRRLEESRRQRNLQKMDAHGV